MRAESALKSVESDDLKQRTKTARQMRRLAWLLDASIRVPFTRFRLGLDSLMGLVPGVGDAAGAAMSGFIIAQAWRMGASPATLGRMIGNVLLETVVGVVPLLGDVFDMAYKANLRNVRLALAQIDRDDAAARGHRGARAGAVWIVLIAVAVLVIVAAVLALVITGLIAIFG